MRVAVYTLGCKLNQCESEALASSFDSRGFFIVAQKDNADIYIVNTCTVTSKAEQKARRMIRKFSSEHPDSVVIVTGCYAQLDRIALELGDNVIVVSHDLKSKLSGLPEYLNVKKPEASEGGIAKAVRAYFKTEDEEESEPDRFWYDSVDFSYHTRAFLKIQDGCNNRCAYCRVTIARGDSVSLDVESVLGQFERLRTEGYREVVLTGVNLTSYSSNGAGFSELLGMLASRAGNTRIRLSSLEPETIDRKMGEAIKSPSICSHFHIPVQSGSDHILELMRRHNNREKIIKAVDLLRSVKDDPFIAADVIAGFPGETDEDFEQTRSLLEQCDFSHLHVFPFSPRPGTEAFGMKNKVPERIAAERTAVLRRLSEENFRRYCRRQIGRELEILLEGERNGFPVGTSGNYLKSAICGIIKKGSGLCRARVLSGCEAEDKFSGDFTDETLLCSFIDWT